MLGRFISADWIVPGAPGLTVHPFGSVAGGTWGKGGGGPANAQDLNRYSYALNNPVRNTDPSGHFIDIILDVGFIAYGIYDIAANGYTAERGLALGADVAAAVIPGVTGAGMAVRGANAAVDGVRAVDNANDARVGRWMDPSEYKAMSDTGMVQESRSGTTHVAFPASPGAFGKQAPEGSVYAEFDVPAQSIKVTDASQGWAKILGPNTLEGRNAARRGRPFPQMPPARNIEHVSTKGKPS
jgi:RHS repeat-associated protein